MLMENDTSPAEELYKTVRKVNWDGINGLTRSIGKQGESLVLELEKHYLRAIGRDDLASQVTYVEDGKATTFSLIRQTAMRSILK